ncbi:MAG: NUDIX hydrolase [Candidatus Sumerlaeia bacterium]|nr:NUDIX hydrolase [Candidatus Sumerlaeia bacterium]
MSEQEISEAEYIRNYNPNRWAHPSLAADAVVFTFDAGRLRVLLIQRKNHPFRGWWTFPGGFVDDGEDPDVAVRRELREEAGLDLPEMWQFGAFGRPDRDPRCHVVSIAYFGILVAGAQTPRADDDAAAAGWFPVAELPPLAFDHKDVFARVMERLRRELERPSFALKFFRKRVTGGEIAALYREVFGKNLNRTRLLRRLRQFCREEPTLHRPLRISRRRLRQFEAARAKWWV